MNVMYPCKSDGDDERSNAGQRVEEKEMMRRQQGLARQLKMIAKYLTYNAFIQIRTRLTLLLSFDNHADISYPNNDDGHMSYYQ